MRLVLVLLPPLLAAAPVAAADQAKPAGSSAPKPAYAGHGAASIPLEVVRRFAPPPLASDVSRRIQAMLDLRAPGPGHLSPDGSKLFFNWTVTGTSQVWRVDRPGAFPVQMTGGEDPTRVVDVTPDGRELVLQRDRKGEENPGLYLQPATGGPLVPIQHLPGVQTAYQFTSSDGRWIYYRANDRTPDAYALYRYERGSGQREAVFTEPGLWSIADHEADGALLLSKATGAITREFYLLKGGTLTPLLGQGEAEEYQARLTGRPGELFVLTSKRDPFRRLYRWKGGAFTPITPAMKKEISGFDVDRARRRLYYAVNDEGAQRLYALDAATLAQAALPRFEDAVHVVGGAATWDGRYVTLGVGRHRAPFARLVYDFRTRALTTWVIPSVPEVDLSRFAEAELTRYPARDGTQIPAYVRRPARCEPGPCPVVIHFHGGPEGQSVPGFNAGAQLFVDAGFILVEPNVRGSEGYGRAWLRADDGPKRLAVITDIEDAATWARTAFAESGRPPKVGIFGGSYGGYSTLMGMTRFAGAFDAGVSNVGMSDLTTFLRNTAPYRRALRISEYGDPDKDAEALRQLSPVTYLDRIRAPLLLIQGLSDPRVPAGEAIQIHAALEARKIPTQLILFPDEGHGAQRRENKVLELGHTLAFFERHLKAGAPAEAGAAPPSAAAPPTAVPAGSRP